MAEMGKEAGPAVGTDVADGGERKKRAETSAVVAGIAAKAAEPKAVLRGCHLHSLSSRLSWVHSLLAAAMPLLPPPCCCHLAVAFPVQTVKSGAP